MFSCTCKAGHVTREEIELILPSGETIVLNLRVVKDKEDSDPWKVAVRIDAPDSVRINRRGREQFKQFGPADCVVKPTAKPQTPETPAH